MAGARTSVHTFSIVVSGQYEYKSAWTSLTDKTCKCIMWEGNKCNKYIVNDQLFNIRIEDAHLSYISREMLRISSFSFTYCTILTFIKLLQLRHAVFKWDQMIISFLKAGSPAASVLAEPVCLKVKMNSIFTKANNKWRC